MRQRYYGRMKESLISDQPVKIYDRGDQSDQDLLSSLHPVINHHYSKDLPWSRQGGAANRKRWK